MVFTTSICANYLPKAAALAKSLKKYHPDSKFILCLVERYVCEEAKTVEFFDQIVLGRELGIANFDNFIFRHTIVEASTAVKGHLMKYLTDQFVDEKNFVYVDPDCLAFSPFEELKVLLAQHEIVLAPHLLTPGNINMEISTLKHGVFNLGFLALSRGLESKRFIDWWSERLNYFCFDDVDTGLFTDQKWVNLAPCFFDIHVLRHSGYNFGTWNFKERKIWSERQGFVVNGETLRFIHYSGFDRGTFLWAAKEWAPQALGVAKQLDAIYRQKTGEFNFSKSPAWSYSSYTNGKKIKGWERRNYRRQLISADNPFEYNRKVLMRMLKGQIKKNIEILKRIIKSWVD